MKYVLLVITIVFLGQSCSPSLSYYTDRLHEEQRWSDAELKRIQFYLSEDIVLRRDAGNSKSRLEDGQIQIVEGRKVEEVVFKAGTPGVCVFSPGGDKLAISFEDSSDRFLMFGPSEKNSGRYVLLAKKWKRNYGEISYDDRTWTTSTESAYTYLLVDLKRASDTKYKKKTVSGRKVR